MTGNEIYDDLDESVPYLVTDLRIFQPISKGTMQEILQVIRSNGSTMVCGGDAQVINLTEAQRIDIRNEEIS